LLASVVSRYVFCALALLILGTGPTLNRGLAVEKDSNSQDEKPALEHLKFVREFSGPDDVIGGLPPTVEKSLTVLFGPADPHTALNNLAKPFAITTDSNHRVFVADPTAGLVHIFGFENYTYAFLGGPESNLRSPVGVAVDADNRVYVTDPPTGLIMVYDSRGKFVRYFGKVGERESYFQTPTGIAIDKQTGHIYVCDSARHMVILLDKEGHILGRFGKRLSGNGPGEFRYPSRVLIAGEEIIVLDAGNLRVQILDLSGRYKREIRIPELSSDTGLAFDAQKNIYVTNIQLGAIDVFSCDGQFLYRFGSMGTAPGEFRRPAGMWVESGKLLYITDILNKRVQLFEIQGTN
jgi:DNA-binding beta-propeller fold protein YncE